jgi:hypothetical protein
VNRNVSAGQKLSIGIGNIDFGQERVRPLVDGIGGARQCAMEGPAGIFVECQECGGAGQRGAGKYFRNRDEDSKCVDCRKMEQLPPRVITLIVSCNALSTIIEVRMESGMETAMINVLRQLPRKSRIIKPVRQAATTASRMTDPTAARTNRDWSATG